MTTDEYQRWMQTMLRDWKRVVWPTMQAEGFSQDTAIMVYMMHRLEQSMDEALYEPAPPREPWEEDH